MAHFTGFTQPFAVTSGGNDIQSSNRAGRWFLVSLGLAIALLGTLFVGLLGRSFLRAWDMRSWPEVSCVILSSEIEERRHDDFSPMEYRQNLTYGYEWKDKPHTGTHLTLRDNPWSSKRELVEEKSKDYPTGKVTSCRVNPASPEISVLKADSLAPGYTIWFPGLFVVGGLGISIRALRRR